MMWITYLLGLTSGLATGQTITTRRIARHLRNLAHYEAADIVDPHGEAS
jgi:hypothetical protein